jgi:hypothetical protein
MISPAIAQYMCCRLVGWLVGTLGIWNGSLSSADLPSLYEVLERKTRNSGSSYEFVTGQKERFDMATTKVYHERNGEEGTESI